MIQFDARQPNGLHIEIRQRLGIDPYAFLWVEKGGKVLAEKQYPEYNEAIEAALKWIEDEGWN